MTPTIAIGLGLFLMLAAFALFVFSLMRTSARADRDATRIHQDLLLRYTGEGRPCIRCGLPTHYSLKRTPIHPECREAFEADMAALKNQARALYAAAKKDAAAMRKVSP